MQNHVINDMLNRKQLIIASELKEMYDTNILIKYMGFHFKNTFRAIIKRNVACKISTPRYELSIKQTKNKVIK